MDKGLLQVVWKRKYKWLMKYENVSDKNKTIAN